MDLVSISISIHFIIHNGKFISAFYTTSCLAPDHKKLEYCKNIYFKYNNCEFRMEGIILINVSSEQIFVLAITIVNV